MRYIWNKIGMFKLFSHHINRVYLLVLFSLSREHYCHQHIMMSVLKKVTHTLPICKVNESKSTAYYYRNVW